MAKYAPANEQGLKPYVVEWTHWGKDYSDVFWAETVGDARRQAVAPGVAYEYVRSARRATPADIEEAAS